LLIAGMITNIIYVLTGRAAYLSLLLLAPYGAWLVAPRFRLLLSGAILVFSALLLYYSEIAHSRIGLGLEELTSTITGEAEAFSSIGIRWVFWENSLRMIAVNPILGSGSGGFSTAYAVVVSDIAGWRGIVTDDPHQQYLLIAAEQGLVGLFFFLAILISFSLSRGDDTYRLAAQGILLMTVMNGMFNGHFNAFVEGRLFWVSSGAFLCSTVPSYSFRRAAMLPQFPTSLIRLFNVIFRFWAGNKIRERK